MHQAVVGNHVGRGREQGVIGVALALPADAFAALGPHAESEHGGERKKLAGELGGDVGNAVP